MPMAKPEIKIESAKIEIGRIEPRAPAPPERTAPKPPQTAGVSLPEQIKIHPERAQTINIYNIYGDKASGVVAKEGVESALEAKKKGIESALEAKKKVEEIRKPLPRQTKPAPAPAAEKIEDETIVDLRTFEIKRSAQKPKQE